MPFPSLFRGRNKSAKTSLEEGVGSGGGGNNGVGVKLSLASLQKATTNHNYQGYDDPSLSFSLEGSAGLSAAEAAIAKGRQQAQDDSSNSQEPRSPEATTRKRLPRPSMAGELSPSMVQAARKASSSLHSTASAESNSQGEQQSQETATKKQLPRPSMAEGSSTTPGIQEAAEKASSFHSAASAEADAAAGRRSSRSSRSSGNFDNNRRKSRSKSRSSQQIKAAKEGGDNKDGNDDKMKKKKKKDRARSKSRHRSKSRTRSKSKSKTEKEGTTNNDDAQKHRSSRSKSRSRSKSIRRDSAGGDNGTDVERARRRERSKSRSRIEFERSRNRERSKSRTRKGSEKKEEDKQQELVEEQREQESTRQYKSDDSCSAMNASSQVAMGDIDANGNSTGLYLQLDFAAPVHDTGDGDKQVTNLGVSQNFAVDEMEECSVTSELTEMSDSTASTTQIGNKSTVPSIPTVLSAPAPSRPKSSANRLQAYSNMRNVAQTSRSSAPRAAVAAIQIAEMRRTKTSDITFSPPAPLTETPPPPAPLQSPRSSWDATTSLTKGDSPRSTTRQLGIDLDELAVRANSLKKLTKETIEQQEEHDTEMEERIKDLLSKAKAKYVANRKRQAIRHMKKVQRAKSTLATISDAIDELEEIAESIDTNIRRLGLLHAVKRSSFDVVAPTKRLSNSSRSMRHVEDDSIDSNHGLPEEVEDSDVNSNASGGATSTVSAKINQNNMEIARTIHGEIDKAERGILDFIRRAASTSTTSANDDDGDQVESKDDTEGDDSKLLNELAKLVEQD